MADKITLCFKHVKREIDVPEDYEELLESFHEKFEANKNNIFNFSYEDKFGQEHTLKKDDICPSIFFDIKQLTVEEEVPPPVPIEQIKESYEKKIKNLKETYEQKINDKEKQIENLNQQIKDLHNEIDKLKRIQGNKEKIEEFRKEFNLDSRYFKDEMLLKVLVENNFDFANSFRKLVD